MSSLRDISGHELAIRREVERLEREVRQLRRDFEDYKWSRESAEFSRTLNAQRRTLLLSTGGAMVLAWAFALFGVLITR